MILPTVRLMMPWVALKKFGSNYRVYGVMERWSDGVLKFANKTNCLFPNFSSTPALRYSNTPRIGILE
jgi:hypothetical protein